MIVVAFPVTLFAAVQGVPQFVESRSLKRMNGLPPPGMIDCGRLVRGYQEHLGVTPVPTSYEEQPWTQEAGPTVFAPLPHDTTYFGQPQQAWMVNFRVGNLRAMVAQLRAADIQVEVDPEIYIPTERSRA